MVQNSLQFAACRNWRAAGRRDGGTSSSPFLLRVWPVRVRVKIAEPEKKPFSSRLSGSPSFQGSRPALERVMFPPFGQFLAACPPPCRPESSHGPLSVWGAPSRTFFLQGEAPGGVPRAQGKHPSSPSRLRLQTRLPKIPAEVPLSPRGCVKTGGKESQRSPGFPSPAEHNLQGLRPCPPQN